MVNKCYRKHKERLQKEARERYQNLSEEERDRKSKKARERYQNFTQEEKGRQYYQKLKQKLPEYRNYYLTHKK